MNLKEIKKLIKLSGGKLIIADDKLNDSFVVMKLNEYLREREEGAVFDEDYFEDCFDDCSCEDDCLDEDCACECHEDEKKFDFEGINEVEELDDFSAPSGLTDEELLSRINVDIAELKERKNEETVEEIEVEKENEDPKYEQV